jgi:hypothetical protein
MTVLFRSWETFRHSEGTSSCWRSCVANYCYEPHIVIFTKIQKLQKDMGSRVSYDNFVAVLHFQHWKKQRHEAISEELVVKPVGFRSLVSCSIWVVLSPSRPQIFWILVDMWCCQLTFAICTNNYRSTSFWYIPNIIWMFRSLFGGSS